MEFAAKSFEVFHKGGPVMYFLLMCSLMVVAIGVERFIYYKENRTDAQALLAQITPALEHNDWECALAACRQTRGAGAKVAGKGIQSFLRGSLHIESVLEGEAALAASRLRENLNHLDTIVTIAPLLGLLGTVIGMIGSFSIMNVKAGQPLAITGGVGEALVATAAGLCVATLAMVMYSYFSHRLDRMITDIEEVCTVIIGQVKREKNHEVA